MQHKGVLQLDFYFNVFLLLKHNGSYLGKIISSIIDLDLTFKENGYHSLFITILIIISSPSLQKDDSCPKSIIINQFPILLKDTIS